MPRRSDHPHSAHIAAHLAGEIIGDGTVPLSGFSAADLARPGDLTFAEKDTHFAAADASAASAILVSGNFTSAAKTLIRVPNARVAAARVDQAAAYVRLSGSTLYPLVNLRATGPLGADCSGGHGLGLLMNWELDLWGRVRAGQAAAQDQYASAELDVAYARQSIAALVAKSWFLATEARLQKAIAQDMVAAAERQPGLAQDRLRVGFGNEYDRRRQLFPGGGNFRSRTSSERYLSQEIAIAPRRDADHRGASERDRGSTAAGRVALIGTRLPRSIEA